MHQQIPLEQIDESPSNPRRVFDEAALAELAASIEEHGVIQPVMVRRSSNSRYELVFGARRYRASKLAGLETIPAQIRELSDDVVLELQLIENDKRSDITPLEEADGFARLVSIHGREPGDIAKRLGRPDDYVRRRLLLSRLIEPLRSLLNDDRIGIGSGELLAALPVESQRELANGELSVTSCWTMWDSDAKKNVPDPARPKTWDTYTVRRAIASISRQLDTAQWALDDSTLAECRACTGCPSRTDHQATLFDTGEAARCLDGECWAAKLEAWTERRRQEIAAAGEELVEGDDVAKIVGNHWDPRRRYRAENETCDELLDLYSEEELVELGKEAGGTVDLTRSWADVAGDAPRTWVITGDGRVVGYIRLEDAIEAIESGGGGTPSNKIDELTAALKELLEKPGRGDADREKHQKREAEKLEAEAEAAARRQVIDRIVELVAKNGLGPVVWLLHQELVDTTSPYTFSRRAAPILERRLGESVEPDDVVDEWTHLVEQLTTNELASLIIEFQLSRYGETFDWDRANRNQEFEGLVALVDFAPVFAPDYTAVACRECGCTDPDACEGGCWWAEEDLCSTCDERLREAAEEPTTFETSIYNDERFSSPEAAELHQYVKTTKEPRVGRLEQHTVKVLREVLIALVGDLRGATLKRDLMVEIMKAVRSEAEAAE